VRVAHLGPVEQSTFAGAAALDMGTSRGDRRNQPTPREYLAGLPSLLGSSRGRVCVRVPHIERYIVTGSLPTQVRNGDENLKREIRCIKLVKHENVIKLLEFINEEDVDKVYLVFELANLFSLQSLCELAKVHPIQVLLPL
jgi:serine/threonine protein kinase